MSIVVWAIVLAFVVWFARPIDQAAAVFSQPVGYIEHGGKFGVSIGMSAHQAEQVLLARRWDPMSQAGAYLVTDCVGREPSSTQHIRLYFDRSWRSGAFCFVEEAGKVVAIGWSFMPLVI